ncbi:MAG: hypothetical protein WED01_04205 [Candidatus Rokuibacteriota bacterium]
MTDMAAEGPDDLAARNRRLLRLLLAIMAALVVSAFLIGIRW